MFKTAKVYVIILSFSLIFLLSMGGQPVKSEQPVQSDHLINVDDPQELDLKQDRTIPRTSGGLGNRPELLKHRDPFLDLMSEEVPIVKGVYATGWMTGKSGFLEKMLDFTAKTEVNSMVIDVKE